MGRDIEADAELTIPSDVVHRASGGETVLMRAGSEQYFALEGAAGRIWELVSTEGHSTVGSVIATLQDEFEVDPAVVEVDVRRMVQELEFRGLMTVA